MDFNVVDVKSLFQIWLRYHFTYVLVEGREEQNMEIIKSNYGNYHTWLNDNGMVWDWLLVWLKEFSFGLIASLLIYWKLKKKKIYRE